jgi:hypothetical protein
MKRSLACLLLLLVAQGCATGPPPVPARPFVPAWPEKLEPTQVALRVTMLEAAVAPTEASLAPVDATLTSLLVGREARALPNVPIAVTELGKTVSFHVAPPPESEPLERG